MAEKYLKGAILENGEKLTAQSVDFLQKGCGFDFQLPKGSERLSIVTNFPLAIAFERNEVLAEGVANGKYHWAIVGLDMVAELPDSLLDRVKVIRSSLGFGYSELRLGVASQFFEGAKTLAELPLDTKVPQLKDLPPRTRVATSYPNLLNRIVNRQKYDLRVVADSTPMDAPENRKILVVADVAQSDVFNQRQVLVGQVLLESQAVLLRSRHMPKEKERIFNNMFLSRVDRALSHPSRWLSA